MRTIYLAGGCFWGVERYFSLAKGVVSTTVGYANGTKENPSYQDLKRGEDDASETVRIEYDESVLPLTKLLELYLRVVDPYSVNKQGEDEGVQYRTGVYFTSEEDRKTVLDYFSSVLEEGYAIEICPLRHFYSAEEYHQRYLEKNPTGYCHISMAKLRDEERK